VIDPDYTGTIKVVLYNSSKEDFYVGPYSRIAQLIIEKTVETEAEELDAMPTGIETSRGEGGFGSTGQ